MTDAWNVPLGVFRRRAFYKIMASVFVSILANLAYAIILETLSPNALEWGVAATVLVLSIPVFAGVVFELPLLVLRPHLFADLPRFGVVLRALAVVVSLAIYGEVWPRWFGLSWIPDPLDNLVVLGIVASAASVVSTTALRGFGASSAKSTVP